MKLSFVPPKVETPKHRAHDDVNHVMQSLLNPFFFFSTRRLSTRFPSRQLQLCSLEDDKCLSAMFLLALPAHHINQTLWKLGGRDMTWWHLAFQMKTCRFTFDLRRFPLLPSSVLGGYGDAARKRATAGSQWTAERPKSMKFCFWTQLTEPSKLPWKPGIM